MAAQKSGPFRARFRAIPHPERHILCKLIFCKEGTHMEPQKPMGDVDDLIFQDTWEISER